MKDKRKPENRKKRKLPTWEEFRKAMDDPETYMAVLGCGALLLLFGLLVLLLSSGAEI